MTKNQKESEDKSKSTQIGLHAVKNLLGSSKQLDLFTEYGRDHQAEIQKLGFNLTDFEMKIFEGILRGFSNTQYKGNMKPTRVTPNQKNASKHGEVSFESPYKYISNIPCLKVKQREIIQLAGIKKTGASASIRTVEALKKLATTAYCFYYSRLAFNDEGEPVKRKNGAFVKEEVIAFGSLFSINIVQDEKSKKVKHYEIKPNPIFLDQRERYFVLIPNDWRDEVQNLVGSKKTSAYTFRFLLFLRYTFELKRRSKTPPPYVIKWSPKEIAIAIHMPESIYHRKKATMRSILDSVYDLAHQLGYLTGYTITETVDILYLDEQKYHSPNKPEALVHKGLSPQFESTELTEANELYDFLVSEKTKIDPKYKSHPKSPSHLASLKHLAALLQSRSKDEIKRVISWGFGQSYWVSRIGTASKLRKHFHEAVASMNVASPDHLSRNNKEFLDQILGHLGPSRHKDVRVEKLNKYVEIGGGGTYQPSCINYDSKKFKSELVHALEKWGFSLPKEELQP